MTTSPPSPPAPAAGDPGPRRPDASWEAWSALDDTLADGPAPAAVPPEARAWLSGQRFVHGLLRAMQTADASAREARIASVLERATPAAPVATRRWYLIAAAAAMLSLGVIWATLPPRTLSAEAAVRRAASLLAEDVDRQFLLEVTIRGQGPEFRNQFTLTARPGSRFLVEGKMSFGTMQFGDLRAGCDGERVWFMPANGLFKRDVPLAEADRLLGQFGGALDLGYLDVHALVYRLPETCELSEPRVEAGPAGERWVRIDAKARRAAPDSAPSDLRLWYDEATGMVVRIESESTAVRGGVQLSRRAVFGYRGVVDGVDYRRPW